MRLREEALEYHRVHHGKIEVVSRVPLRDQQDLSLAYTPGVAEPCKQIQIEPETIYDYTNRGNLVAILTDGTAVLGLGDIGPGAGLPVMEGKSVLFKAFGGVDAFPILVDTHDVDKICEIMKLIAPGFGGVNLEDIAAPRCFEIERRLKEELDIPVFHDDQHGTAIVVGAAFLNALRVVKKDIGDVRVVVNGAGASGIMVSRMLVDLGVKDITLCDRQGLIYKGRDGLNPDKQAMAEISNPRMLKGSLADGLVEADAFIGLSVAGAVTMEMLRPMRKNAIVFALANPVPEIWPVQAVEVGAAVVGTGRSDFANQINNVLGFPGVFRGALDVRASKITEGMKQAAARSIAALITDKELRADYIIPNPLDRRVAPAVARGVAEAAIKEGVARRVLDPAEVEQHCIELTTGKEGQA